tara:strand:+ start:1968 stop:2309 length:342 start_codon:yes stop_codon:yes gene_type:complete
MKIRQITILIFGVISIFSCRKYIDKETTDYPYFDRQISDTISTEKLKAVTNEEYLQYGVKVAFVTENNDTIIPFGKYAYYGTNTLEFYANVIEHPNDSTWATNSNRQKSKCFV